MQPDARFITIPNGILNVERLLTDLFILPRIRAVEWSRVTLQTPNMKVGYPGQHLVSLVTGVTGERSGARGNDLMDGSEIKSCSRVDQVDKCKDCKNSVLRIESFCSNCGSTNIDRKKDSKWLFTIRSENDLNVLTRDMNRVIIILADYPEFSLGNFDDIRFEIYEIWPNSPRCSRFTELMRNYYNNIYSAHIAKYPKKTPAPKNFWPESYQFYLCNPIKTFSATVTNSLSNPKIFINSHIPENHDRNLYASLDMPIELLNRDELEYLANVVPIQVLRQNNPSFNNIDNPREILSQTSILNEEVRGYLQLRPDSSFTLDPYSRKKN